VSDCKKGKKKSDDRETRLIAVKFYLTRTPIAPISTEQIAMRPRPRQYEDKCVVEYAAYEQPIVENVAFPMADPIACERMIPILGRQWISRS
jgi:hypothetical protein